MLVRNTLLQRLKHQGPHPHGSLFASSVSEKKEREEKEIYFYRKGHHLEEVDTCIVIQHFSIQEILLIKVVTNSQLLMICNIFSTLFYQERKLSSGDMLLMRLHIAPMPNQHKGISSIIGCEKHQVRSRLQNARLGLATVQPASPKLNKENTRENIDTQWIIYSMGMLQLQGESAFWLLQEDMLVAL